MAIRHINEVHAMLEQISEMVDDKAARKVSKKRMRHLARKTIIAAAWTLEPQASKRQQDNAMLMLFDIKAELRDGQKRNRVTEQHRHVAL